MASVYSLKDYGTPEQPHCAACGGRSEPIYLCISIPVPQRKADKRLHYRCAACWQSSNLPRAGRLLWDALPPIDTSTRKMRRDKGGYNRLSKEQQAYFAAYARRYFTSATAYNPPATAKK